MFKINNKHQQTDMFGFENMISATMFKELEESEEQGFYELIFCNFKEEDEDKKNHEELFSPYLRNSSGQFIYRLTQEDIPKKLQRVGEVYKGINNKLKSKYSEIEIFNIFERVYLEHFTEPEEKIILGNSEELTSSMTQSPDDIEATYRKKEGKEFYGETINIVETCNPDNKLNLITDIPVRANNIDDSKELNERIYTGKEKSTIIQNYLFRADS